MKVYAIDNPSLEVRLRSSSGGVFSILASNIIKENGIVYGVRFDKEWNIVHHKIEDLKELDIIQRSKYAFSKIGNSFKEIQQYLGQNRKVLFSGTPCQIAALKNLIGENNNLFLVEIICHGAPTNEYWKIYLNELIKSLGYKYDDLEFINFRDKRNGWKNYNFTVKFRDGKEFTQNHHENIYMNLFLKNYILKKACFCCKFKYPNGSKADITLGDLWGIDKIKPSINNNIGTSLVIVRTKQGAKIIEKLDKIELSFEDVIKFNPAIVSPPIIPIRINKFRNYIKKGKNLKKIYDKLEKPSLINRIITRIKSIIKL